MSILAYHHKDSGSDNSQNQFLQFRLSFVGTGHIYKTIYKTTSCSMKTPLQYTPACHDWKSYVTIHNKTLVKICSYLTTELCYRYINHFLPQQHNAPQVNINWTLLLSCTDVVPSETAHRALKFTATVIQWTMNRPLVSKCSWLYGYKLKNQTNK